jgi:hypothetical protein
MFIASDCYPGVKQLLMNRPIQESVMLDALCKATLELTSEYKHPLLEDTGPTVQLVPFQNAYAPNYFLNAPENGLDISKVNSFFFYDNPFIPPSATNNQTNSGYNLKYRSFDAIENLLNIPGSPIYWARNNNQIYIASMPDQAYDVYMRYQTQHPGTTAVGGFLATQQIMMADEWREILEYAAALRIAPQINLSGKRTELREALYGDQKFQQSSGIEGAPGLIFQRTSQRNRDQATTTRRLRLRMGSV